MPSTVSARARIARPIAECWERLRDLTRAVEYVPGLTGCRITTERREGVGASRIVSHAQFGDMDETVVDWEEGTGFTIRLHKGDRPAAPFAEARFTYRLTPDSQDAGSTIIETAMTYRLPWGTLGALLDRLVMQRMMKRNVRDVAVSLAESYETKAPVPPERLPALRSKALD